MNGTINNQQAQRYLLNRRVGEAAHKESMVMSIRTGLSVTVVGHLIRVERDVHNHRATVVVSVLPGHDVTGLEGPALKVAADLLAERARRFFGRDWTVVDWAVPPQQRGRRTG